MFSQMIFILNEVAKKHVLVIAQACESLCTESPSYYKLLSFLQTEQGAVAHLNITSNSY